MSRANDDGSPWTAVSGSGLIAEVAQSLLEPWQQELRYWSEDGRED